MLNQMYRFYKDYKFMIQFFTVILITMFGLFGIRWMLG